jgi:hypothetical protein
MGFGGGEPAESQQQGRKLIVQQEDRVRERNAGNLSSSGLLDLFLDLHETWISFILQKKTGGESGIRKQGTTYIQHTAGSAGQLRLGSSYEKALALTQQRLPVCKFSVSRSRFDKNETQYPIAGIVSKREHRSGNKHWYYHAAGN